MKTRQMTTNYYLQMSRKIVSNKNFHQQLMFMQKDQNL